MKHTTLVFLLSAFLTIIAAGAFSTYAANRVSDQTSDRAVCQMLHVNLDAYQENSPQTPLGKNLQAKYQNLYESQCR